MDADETVNVRYMVSAVGRAVGFYSTHFGFQSGTVELARLRRRRQGPPPPAAERSGKLGRSAYA